MTYKQAITIAILNRLPFCSERAVRKLSLYASNNLRLCGNPSFDSVEFETIMNGITNAAVIGTEENIK